MYFLIIICSRVKQSIGLCRYRQLVKAAVSEVKKWYRDFPKPTLSFTLTNPELSFT